MKSKHIKLVKKTEEEVEHEDLLTCLKKLTETNKSKGKEAALKYLNKLSDAKEKEEKKKMEEKNKKKTERNLKKF